MRPLSEEKRNYTGLETELYEFKCFYKFRAYLVRQLLAANLLVRVTGSLPEPFSGLTEPETKMIKSGKFLGGGRSRKKVGLT